MVGAGTYAIHRLQDDVLIMMSSVDAAQICRMGEGPGAQKHGSGIVEDEKVHSDSGVSVRTDSEYEPNSDRSSLEGVS